MKRSEINAALNEARKVISSCGITLPGFAYWDAAQWKKRLPELENLIKIMLGWDVTDFGRGDFKRCGSVLFTVRNGSKSNPEYGTPYAEKLIFQSDEYEQEIPLHYHMEKTEDIINRGGGILMIQLYNKNDEGGLDTGRAVQVRMDAIDTIVPAGGILEIERGASITLTPGIFHRFWAKKGAGVLVAGEVSSLNNDKDDNFFLLPSERFTGITEDEPAIAPLCNEYNLWMHDLQ